MRQQYLPARARLWWLLISMSVVLAACGSTSAAQPSKAVPPTATTASAGSPTPYPTKPPPPPTPTPISLAAYPSIAQAWGASAIVAHFAPGSFQVEDIAPDGMLITGYMLSADKAQYLVGWLNVATRQFTQIEATPAIGQYKPITPPYCCKTNGRYFAGYNGVTEGASVNYPWYYDAQTKQFHLTSFIEAIPLGVMAPGIAIFNDFTGMGLGAVNIQTGAVTAYTGFHGTPGIWAYSWPYVAYYGQNAQGNAAVYLHNLATTADTPLAGIGSTMDIGWGGGALDGDTVFYGMQNGAQDGAQGYVPPSSTTVFEIDHASAAASQPAELFTFPGPLNLGPPTLQSTNGRVVLASATDNSCGANYQLCTYVFAWDRAQRRLVLLTPTDPQAAMKVNDTSVLLSGTMLMLIDPVSGDVTIYDTSRLPG